MFFQISPFIYFPTCLNVKLGARRRGRKKQPQKPNSVPLSASDSVSVQSKMGFCQRFSSPWLTNTLVFVGWGGDIDMSQCTHTHTSSPGSAAVDSLWLVAVGASPPLQTEGALRQMGNLCWGKNSQSWFKLESEKIKAKLHTAVPSVFFVQGKSCGTFRMDQEAEAMLWIRILTKHEERLVPLNIENEMTTSWKSFRSHSYLSKGEIVHIKRHFFPVFLSES